MNVKIYKNVILDMIVVMFDIIIVLGSGIIGFSVIRYISPNFEKDYIQIVTYLALDLFTLWAYELYTSVIRDNYELKLSVILSNILAACGCIIFIVVRDLLVIHSIRWYLCLNTIFMAVITSLIIYAEKRLYVKLIKSFEGNVKLLILDDSTQENDFAKKIKYSSLSVYDAWYIMVNDTNPEEVNHIIETIFPKYNTIFISPRIHEAARNKFISSAVTLGKDLYLIPELYNSIVMKSTLMEFDDTPALKIKKFGLSKFESFFKRILDVSVAVVGIIVSSPIMLACAIAIKIDSPGPIIYKQERLTIHKKPFNIYKFRSMVDDAEKLTGPVLATYDDPRVTKVGRLLRTMRLDELPQLFNVLSGNMSVVGPRPERQKFVEEFEKEIIDYNKRFFVKAGITGMSHVYARYDTGAKDRVLFDMLYIRDYSFILDVKLILLTLKIMFMKNVAAGVKSNKYKNFDRRMNTPEQRGIYGDVFSNKESKEKEDDNVKSI